MKEKNEVKFYNVLFPVWMMIWFPSLLWLLLIPANYLIDHLVVWLSNRKMPGAGDFCKKNVWKICLAGFAADFAGSFVLYIFGTGTDFKWLEAVSDGIFRNPFSNAGSFAFVLAAVCISAVIIYCVDKGILERAGLPHEEAKRTARNLAVFTAPYLFFIPSELFWA